MTFCHKETPFHFPFPQVLLTKSFFEPVVLLELFSDFSVFFIWLIGKEEIKENHKDQTTTGKIYTTYLPVS
jgi:hypothetical protein